MATIKKAAPKKGISPNTDARNVAFGQPSELRYVCSQFKKNGEHLGMGQLKATIKNLGVKKVGTRTYFKRSREKIYIALRGQGFVRVPRKKKAK